MKTVLRAFIVLVLAVGMFGTAHAVIPQIERDALIELYNSTNGDEWANNTNWLGAGGTECTWYGITCDIGNTTVVGIDLNGNNLSGNIPPELGYLSNLRNLYLNNNQLSGNIPPELTNLSNLRYLVLASNQLSGNIPPELGYLSNLEYLHLGYNQLSGNIPPELTNLSNLEILGLGYNQLSGNIPPELGYLSNLEYLGLFNNQLSGNIPPELGYLSNLRNLYIFNNQLSGNIPPELTNLSNLGYLVLASNLLSGNILPELGYLSNLKTLSLGYNQLSGNIPPELGNLSNLEYLGLGYNQLSGNIPPELRNLASLERLRLNSNQLVGEVPYELINLTNLVDDELDLRWNGLYTYDSALRTFLNSKQWGGDWESTQTIAPANLTAGVPTATSIHLTWTKIAYTSGSGGYEVYYATTSGGPYTLYETTANKSVEDTTVTDLNPNTTYFFRLRTVTYSHPYNQNTIYSEYTSEVTAATTKAPVIEVLPMVYDFGDVELGTSSTNIITISNVGEYALTVFDISFQPGSSSDFSITMAPTLPTVVQIDMSTEVEITYTPSAEGYSSAVLEISSNDPYYSLVQVQLSGTGVEVEPPPEEQIAEVLDFIDTSVDQGTLMGDGPGNSAEKRLNALRNMIEAASDLIEHGEIEKACQQLMDAYKKTDGLTPPESPPDFVTGDAASELASMLQVLMTSLGCE
jgi:hypothetical protein